MSSPIPLTRFGLSASDLGNLYQNARFDGHGNLLPSMTMPLSLDVYGDPGELADPPCLRGVQPDRWSVA